MYPLCDEALVNGRDPLRTGVSLVLASCLVYLDNHDIERYRSHRVETATTVATMETKKEP